MNSIVLCSNLTSTSKVGPVLYECLFYIFSLFPICVLKCLKQWGLISQTFLCFLVIFMNFHTTIGNKILWIIKSTKIRMRPQNSQSNVIVNPWMNSLASKDLTNLHWIHVRSRIIRRFWCLDFLQIDTLNMPIHEWIHHPLKI